MSRPGLVIVSPLPPVWSGVADYTARLLPHLAELWDLTVVIADDDAEPAGLANDVRLFRIGGWPWARRLGRGQRMLACLGNSRYHLHVPEMCRAHGGVVLAHDVRMTAFHCLRAAGDPDRHQLSRLVDERHGPELARDIRAMEDRAPVSDSFAVVRAKLEESNALLLGAAVAGADRVCVHSRLAARLAGLELYGTRIPVSVVPFGFPDVAVPREPVAGRICSFGMVGPEKQPALLVEAFAMVHRAVPEATLRFVGPLGGGMEVLLENMAERLGVRSSVSWTDRIDEEAYRGELGRAAVAVQLRAVVNGEASAAVADCLTAGIPTMVSAIGAHAELPVAAAQHVPAGVTPYDLAGRLRTLLLDRPKQRALSNGARRHAARSSFAHAAGALNEILGAAPPMRG